MHSANYFLAWKTSTKYFSSLTADLMNYQSVRKQQLFINDLHRFIIAGLMAAKQSSALKPTVSRVCSCEPRLLTECMVHRAN